MAASLARSCLRFSKRLSVSRVCNVSVRTFVTSSSIFQPRRARGITLEHEEKEGRRTRSVLEDDMDELIEQWDETSEVEDSPSGGHIILQEYRQTLHYFRLIEHEMPKLVGVFLIIRPPADKTV
jgi:small subunit ribosomal protein S35